MKLETYSGSGLATGIAIGVAIGVAMDNLAIGLGIGVALGLCFEPAMANKDKKPADADSKPD